MANELEACMTDRLKFWQERDLARAEVEALNTQIAGYKSRITDLSNQLGTALAESKNREEQVSRLKEEVLEKDAQIKTLTDQLNTKQMELNEMAKEKGGLAIELEQARVQIETLKQQATQGEITLTFGELIQALFKQKITIKKG